MLSSTGPTPAPIKQTPVIHRGGNRRLGRTVRGDQAYAIHARGVLTPISRVEYQHQASYPLWMLSAAALFVAALIFGVTVPHSLWDSTRIARLPHR